jgi:hypothetical protein
MALTVVVAVGGLLAIPLVPRPVPECDVAR